MKKSMKIFWIILILLICVIVTLIFYLYQSKPMFYMLHLDESNKEIISFVGGGVIVDSNYKDSFSFTVKSLIHRNNELVNCSIDYYNQFRIYIGNEERIILDTTKINVDTIYVDGNNHNKLVNDLLNNKDNVYFCFSSENDSTNESCLKAYIIESN